MEAVKNFPGPLTQTDIRRFLGLAGYYKSFMEGFASIISPFKTLTKKCMKFKWSEACDRSFKILKIRMTSSHVFTLSEGTKGFF